MAIAAAEPGPAAVMTWARGSTALPAPQTPGVLVRPVLSTTAKPPSPTSQPSLASRLSALRRDDGPDEHSGPGDDLPVGECYNSTAPPLVRPSRGASSRFCNSSAIRRTSQSRGASDTSAEPRLPFSS